MEFLKEFLDEATYSQVEAQLKGNEKVKLGNLASGEYVSKSKYEDKAKELETANTQIKDLNDKVKEFDGKDMDGLQEHVEQLQSKYDTDTKALRDAALISAAIDDWFESNPTTHRSLIKSQFKDIKVNEKGEVDGVSEAGETLKTKYVDLFPTNDGNGNNDNGEGGVGHRKPGQEKDPGKMSMEEYAEWRKGQ